MDQQRKRHEEEEDRYHELMDQAHEKQLDRWTMGVCVILSNMRAEHLHPS